MVVIGLDPGLNFTGWGILNYTGNSIHFVDQGVVNASNCSSLNDKLHMIFNSLSLVLGVHNVQEASIEKVFVNSNPKSSMCLCYARASTVLSMLTKHINIYEYSATHIKRIVVGNGMASKEQVSFVVRKILGVPDVQLSTHASDALATALCHVYTAKKRV